MGYRWLLFDLDGTLMDFHQAEYRSMESTLQAFGFRADTEVLMGYREINDAYWKMLERGEISADDLALARHRTLFERFGFAGDVAAFQQLYEGALSESCDLIAGALDLLTTLKAQNNCHLAIVTNGFARIQERRIALSGLDAYFEWVFISEQVGFRKPQVEFFEQVFRDIRTGKTNPESDLTMAPVQAILKEQTLIIGDSLTSDILGGADFGIATCWYNPGQQKNTLGIPVDFEIRQLSELTGVMVGKSGGTKGNARAELRESSNPPASGVTDV